MSGEDEPPPKRKPPLAVPFALIALGATAVVVPIILLRRGRGAASGAVRDLHNVPPPIRRVPGFTSYTSSSSRAEGSAPPLHHVKSQPEVASAVGLQKRRNVGVQSVLNRSQTSGILYALKALGIATCIVGASAVTSVFAIRWAMSVQSAEDFAARVRNKIQSLTPMLSSRIYQHRSGPSVENEGEESEEWLWAEVAGRLSKAYEEGGLEQWMTVAERELELEVKNERKRRVSREGKPTGT